MTERKYKVSVDAAVNDRILDHVRFLAHVSIPAANRLYDALAKAIAELENNPKGCPKYASTILADVELRYKLCHKRYRIVFEIVNNNVDVYDIQDCRQDTDKNLL
jgi:plasmid stabilization system protein ParE